MNHRRRFSCLLFTLFLTASGLFQSAFGNEGFSGTWATNSQRSSALDPFRRVVLEIEVQGSMVTISEKHDAGRRNSTEVYELDTRKDVNVIPITWWSANRHIGAFIGGDKTKRMHAEWIDEGKTLKVTSEFVVETSQSETPVRTYAEYRLSNDEQRITRIEIRSTRDLPIVHVYERQ